ncbi:hypothetical protein [Alistipes finegoldii]|uniref:hypothetical protein n=1 Tax=Alistipes finegoldii TaxID=214856 RepID=UPI003AF9A190
MKRNIFIKTLASLGFVLAAFLFTGCSKDDADSDYFYTVGIEDYNYTGSSLLGPMGYLSELDIADRFTITAGKESDADAQALSRFEAEMNKIDRDRLDASASGTYSFRYVLTSVSGHRMLDQRTFTNRQ